MKCLVLAVSTLWFSNAALAQNPGSTENSVESKTVEEKKPEENKTEPAKTVEDEKATAPKPDYAGMILPIGRIGPTVSLTVPQIYNVALDIRLWNQLGLSFEYGPGFDLKASGAQVKTSYWSLNGQWFPWSGTFFVGGKLGFQTIEAKLDADVDVQGQNLDVSVTAKLDTSYVAPYLGWHAMWGGFLLGSDLGVMIPISSSAKVDAKFKNATQAQQDAAAQLDDYKDAVDEAEKAAESVGKQILPYSTLLKIGYLF